MVAEPAEDWATSIAGASASAKDRNESMAPTADVGADRAAEQRTMEGVCQIAKTFHRLTPGKK
jgi:hypothetical protein